MTNLPQNEEIRKAINEYCHLKEVSKNEFATQAGVSSATLSKIENRKWEDIDEKLFRKIWNKVNENIALKIFHTGDFDNCIKACQVTQNHKYMIGLIGDTGMGKSTALSTYSMSSNVYYVVHYKSLRPKQFFLALLREMGISFEGNISEMIIRVADELNTIKNPLLIIDEAGKLTHNMIMYLQELRDKTIKNCGIVLGGMPEFKRDLIKFVNKQKEGYSEFFRRINMWQELEGLSRSEVKLICESQEIKDTEFLKSVQNKKRFGDLQNAITLYKTENYIIQ